MNYNILEKIEYQKIIKQIMRDNPELSYKFVKDIIISLEQARNNQLSDYEFGEQSFLP